MCSLKGKMMSSMATSGSVELSEDWHQAYSREKTVNFLTERMFADAGVKSPSPMDKTEVSKRVAELFDAFD